MTLLGEWRPFESGSSIGATGSEGGKILLDEEHDAGARITLEQGPKIPFSITCEKSRQLRLMTRAPCATSAKRAARTAGTWS